MSPSVPAEFGEHLFVRDRRGIRLTPAGEALLAHARTMPGQGPHGRSPSDLEALPAAREPVVVAVSSVLRRL